MKIKNLATELKIKKITEDTLNDPSTLKIFLETYMNEMGYRHTYSPQYKIRHNEFVRLAKVSIF